MATWIHISSHFKSGYPALQTCTAQSNMVSCRATIATNFVLAEIPSISRNSSRDRRPSTHGRNSFLVTSAIPQQTLKLGDTVHCRDSHVPTQLFLRISNITSDQCQPKQFSNCSPVHRVFFRTLRSVRNSLGNRHRTSRRVAICLAFFIPFRSRIEPMYDYDMHSSIESPLRRNLLPRKVCSVPGTS